MKGCDVFPQLASRQPFSSLHPSVASFFKDYLSGEKAITFGDQFVINTHFPPFPGRAFDTLANQFESLGNAHNRSLYSVTLGVTNWCGLRDACFGTDRPMESLTISSDQAHRTAFYDALEPGSRRNMEERFKVELAKRARKGAYNVIHDYIMCVAQTEKEARKIP